MTILDQIKEIVKLSFVNERIYSEVCTVVSVSESERTCICQPIDDSAELQKVRLQALKDQSVGLVQIPKVDSYVIVTFVDGLNSFVSTFTEVEKILIDTDLVQFNGGSNNGLINITDLVTKLNELVAKVNALYNLLQNWTVTPQDGGLALQTAAKLLSDADSFNKNDFEDTKITH